MCARFAPCVRDTALNYDTHKLSVCSLVRQRTPASGAGMNSHLTICMLLFPFSERAEFGLNADHRRATGRENGGKEHEKKEMRDFTGHNRRTHGELVHVCVAVVVSTSFVVAVIYHFVCMRGCLCLQSVAKPIYGPRAMLSTQSQADFHQWRPPGRQRKKPCQEGTVRQKFYIQLCTIVAWPGAR